MSFISSEIYLQLIILNTNEYNWNFFNKMLCKKKSKSKLCKRQRNWNCIIIKCLEVKEKKQTKVEQVEPAFSFCIWIVQLIRSITLLFTKLIVYLNSSQSLSCHCLKNKTDSYSYFLFMSFRENLNFIENYILHWIIWMSKYTLELKFFSRVINYNTYNNCSLKLNTFWKCNLRCM